MTTNPRDLMERMGLINEKSINAKKRDIKRVENFFKKGNNNLIKCFAVLTAENPDSMKQTTAFNQKANRKLFDELKLQYTIVPTQGKFGNVENSFVVFNISKDNAMYYCGKNEQTSFIWSAINEDGKLVSEYWEKNDPTKPYNSKTNPYVLKDTCNDWVDMSGADDYYTIVGNKFKYSIPFSIFESINTKLNTIIEGETIVDKRKLVNTLVEGVGYGAFALRARHKISDYID